MVDSVSVVIPTRNAGQEFRQTLRAIYAQRIPLPFDVTVVDSGSVDDTLSICQEFPVTCLSVLPSEFQHGDTRNYAVRNTRGSYVVLMVQDALPADDQWLASLMATLISNSRLAGAYSRQIARADAPLAIKWQLELWHEAQERQPVRYIEDLASFEKMSLDEKRLFCAFDNVSAMIRRDVWETLPFPSLPFGEDIAWSLAVMKRGYGIAYVPSSRVIHSHSRPWSYNLRRAYVDRKLLLGLMTSCSSPPSPTSLFGRVSPFVRTVAQFLRDARQRGELTVSAAIQGMGFYLTNFAGTWLAEGYVYGQRRGFGRGLRNWLDRKLARNL